MVNENLHYFVGSIPNTTKIVKFVNKCVQ